MHFRLVNEAPPLNDYVNGPGTGFSIKLPHESFQLPPRAAPQFNKRNDPVPSPAARMMNPLSAHDLPETLDRRARSYLPTPASRLRDCYGEPPVPGYNPTVVDRKGIRDSAQRQLEATPKFAACRIPANSDCSSVADSSYQMDARTAANDSTRRYTPYTLQDYKNTNMPAILGGLGPNTGGDEWRVRKDKMDRMTEYARSTQRTNMRRLISSSAERSIMGEHVRRPEFGLAAQKQRRMADYARRIPRPRPGPVVGLESQMGNLAELERLEQQHCDLASQLRMVIK